ncbi:MAG: MarR family winged helix-turn-helix transcriptional regulator [Burkholderiales bacterium]|jgi:DNA-binding MarR family transcriptional regulator
MPAADVHPALQAASAPRGCTNFKLRRLLRAVGRRYDAHFARAGLKGTQFSLLTAIVSNEPVRPAELARTMGLDASTLTRNLRVLIDAGWVVQGPGEDARSRLVAATPAGRAKQAEARRHWKKAQLEVNALLGAERVAALHALLDDGLMRLGDDGDDGGDGAEAG